MRMVTFTAESGSIVVSLGDKSRSYGPGSRANLDEQIAPGQTLEQALGHYVSLFTPDAPDVKAAPSRRTPTPVTDDKEIG